MTMIEVKTSDLIGAALDWAVAETEGRKRIQTTRREFGMNVPKRVIPSYSTNWNQGGPLLDKHCKSFGCVQDGKDSTWRAFGYGDGEEFDPCRQMRLSSGPTILIAACRAIVAARLGDTVSVPAELVGGTE